MTEERKKLEEIIQNFSLENLVHFFRAKSQKFSPKNESLSEFDDEDFKEGKLLGEIGFSATEKLSVISFQVSKELSECSGKKAQYEKARKILKLWQVDGGIFIFSDQKGDFRFSLVYPEYSGKKR
ncbi:MAG: hypothetical protein COX29_00050 [Candidatus Moranbacteria bacterium CG23_combo_of_CG06-09_8_20_14_all_35_22]|nr:MAG: hypothetical protein COX29_00050 [Candidatus Moranbacteria bacterium CG23_combo_of_CG06-09_8_20_14_all_35_22]